MKKLEKILVVRIAVPNDETESWNCEYCNAISDSPFMMDHKSNCILSRMINLKQTIKRTVKDVEEMLETR